MQNSKKAVSSLPPVGAPKSDNKGEEGKVIVLPNRRNTTRKQVGPTTAIHEIQRWNYLIGCLTTTLPTENILGNSKQRQGEATSNPEMTDKMPFE
jgi:hypothetical protein